MTQKRLDAITLAFIGLGMVSLLVGLFFALTSPPDEAQGYVYRILFVHVPSAWVGMITLFVALAYSLLYIIRNDLRFDRVATACIEVALVFLSLTLFTGMLWGRTTWGVYWQWEPRLTTFAILLVVYIGYFVVRSAIDDPEVRAKASAAVSILGAINVPITYMSVQWWRSIHQVQTFNLASGKSSFDPAMLPALLINILAFSLLYVGFVRLRSVLAGHEAERQELTSPVIN